MRGEKLKHWTYRGPTIGWWRCDGWRVTSHGSETGETRWSVRRPSDRGRLYGWWQDSLTTRKATDQTFPVGAMSNCKCTPAQILLYDIWLAKHEEAP